MNANENPNGATKPEAQPDCGAATGSDASKDKWQVHILGPDDIIPHTDELAALREANAVNCMVARERLKAPNSPLNVWFGRRIND